MHRIIIRCGAAVHEWVALPGWVSGWGGVVVADIMLCFP